MKKEFRNRKIKMIDVLLTIMIVFLVMTAIVLIFSESNSSQQLKSVSSHTPKKDAIKIDQTDSKYEGIKIVTETSNDPLVKYAIQYPQSENIEFNEEVKNHISLVKKSYLQSIDEVEKDKNKKKSELNISFETYVDKNENYSFVLMNNESLPGSMQSSEIQTFHLNPKTGNQIGIKEIFKNDPDVIQEVTSRVRKKIQTNDELKKGLIGHKMQIRTEPKWKNFENYTITEKKITFYFESGSLKDQTAGLQIVSISLKKMDDLLKPDYQVVGEPPVRADEPDTIPEDDIKEEKEQEESSSDSSVEEDSEVQPTSEEKSNDKQIALTFDDGPDPHSTVQILEILKKYNAKATFFMLGSRVEYYPDTAKAVKDAGHEIGNHSWNHPDLSKLPLAKALEEINRTKAIIEKVTGEKPTVFRPPYGAYTEQLSKQTIPPIILWDVDTLDWKYRNSAKLFNEVKRSATNGSTVLMHDIHQSTADGLESVMAYLQSEGYTFVTVSELN